MLSLFHSIDKDHNGKLDKGELRVAFKRAGLAVPNSKLDQFFAEVDENHDVSKISACCPLLTQTRAILPSMNGGMFDEYFINLDHKFRVRQFLCLPCLLVSWASALRFCKPWDRYTHNPHQKKSNTANYRTAIFYCSCPPTQIQG